MPRFGSDLDQLREVGWLVRQPAFDELVETRRRRTRRAWITSASTLAIAAIIAAGALAPIRDNARTETSTLSDPGDVRESAPRHLIPQTAAILEPGTYRMSVATEDGVEGPEALVTVPSGYVEEADWYVVSDDGNEFLAVYAVGRVMRDDCHESKNNAFQPGPSVQDFADALAAQKSSRTTAPEPVSLAGYDGLYLELTGPRDLSACGKFPAGPWEGRGVYGDKQLDRLWILDVNEQRLVVDASHSATSPASDIDTLTTMVNSLEFVPTAP